MESNIRLAIAPLLTMCGALLVCGCSQQATTDAAAGKAVLDRFPSSTVERTFPAALNEQPVVCVRVDGGMMVVADGKAFMRDELADASLDGAYEACAKQPAAKSVSDD